MFTILVLPYGTKMWSMTILAFNLSEFFSEPMYVGLIAGAVLTVWQVFRKKNRYPDNPLITAASNRDLETFKALLQKKKIDVNEVNISRQTPLILATGVFGQKYLIEELLDKGAIDMIDWQEINGNTALHQAVRYNKKALVKLFVQRGANTDLKNDDGKTALDIAKENRKPDLVDILSL